MLAIICVTVLGAGFLKEGLAKQSYAPRIQFPTYVEDQTEMATVVLPAFHALSAVLIAEGDRVARGETIALLDNSGLLEQISDLEHQLLAMHVERRCLLSPTTAQPSNQNWIDADPLMAASIEICLNLSGAHANEIASLHETRLQLLEERQSLIQQTRTVTSLTALSSRDSTPQNLVEITRLRLEENELSVEINALSTDIAEVEAQQQDAIASRLVELAQLIEGKEAEIRSLRNAAQAERLYATSDGIVERVRAVQTRQRLSTDVPLAQIAEAAESRLVLSFQVGTADQTLFTEGDLIELEIINDFTGDPHGFQTQVEKVIANRPGQPEGFTVYIAEPEGLATLLDDPFMRGSFKTAYSEPSPRSAIHQLETRLGYLKPNFAISLDRIIRKGST